jgi:hypothetical protein
VTLGKSSLFVECLMYWRSAKKHPVGPFASSFAESIRRHSAKAPSLSSAHRASSRQREHQRAPFVSFFTEYIRRHSAKAPSLPSVRATTFGKEALPVPRCAFFTECYDLDTRQSTSLSSVTFDKVAEYPFFICFCCSIQTNERYIT